MENAPHAAAVAAKLRKLAEAGTRVVLCGRPPAPDTGAIALTFDNRGGGRELTEHLIGLGHRRLGYIAGPEERTTTRHRLEGHRAALEAHGIEEDAGWTVHVRKGHRHLVVLRSRISSYHLSYVRGHHVFTDRPAPS